MDRKDSAFDAGVTILSPHDADTVLLRRPSEGDAARLRDVREVRFALVQGALPLLLLMSGAIGLPAVARAVLLIVTAGNAGRRAGVGKGLGEGIRQFKKGLNEDAPDDDKPAPPKAQLSEKKDEA